MAGLTNKKRPTDGRLQRPSKKLKRKQEYHSGSESEEDQGFDAVDLLDSDDDIHNANVDQADDHDASSSGEEIPGINKAVKRKPKHAKAAAEEGQAADSDDAEDDDDESDLDDHHIDSESTGRKSKSKRNDPAAFATSLSKILSTKLSTSKRSDPVLARSATAHESSKAAVDSALEAKARRHLKEQKRKALEKGRVKDILVVTNSDFILEPEMSTAEILEAERKLRKIAQRGVVMMFNAVRAAQVNAAQAQKDVKNKGLVGMNRREEKVNELSKKGFLELIASGGGGLKKGALEEA